MKNVLLLASSLVLSLSMSLKAQTGQRNVLGPDIKILETRDLNYVLSENGCVTAALYSEAQFKSAMDLIGNYKNAIEVPLEKMLKAEENYKKAQKEKNATKDKLSALNMELGKAEASIEALDHKLQADLYHLFNETEKANLKLRQKRVDEYRKLIVDSDKTVLDCTGNLIAKYGIVATLYSDSQLEAFKNIVKKVSDELKALGKKKGTADINYMNIYGFMETTPQQLETAFNAVKDLEYAFSRIARKRDLDLMALLTPNQNVELKNCELKIEKYMDKFVTGYQSGTLEAEQEGLPQDRITVWLISRYGCNMATLYDDAQFKKAIEVIEKNNNDIKPLKKALASAKAAYKKALVDPTCTEETFKKLFDEMSKAEYAIELMEHNLSVGLQGMLTNEQAQKLEDNMPLVEEYTNLIVAFDDSFNGSCNYPSSNTGIAATVYNKAQYDSAINILKNSNKELEPLMNRINTLTASYNQLHNNMASTAAQIENAFLEIKKAKFEHEMTGRTRNTSLANLRNTEQNALLDKHELRIKDYLAAMKK